MSDTSSTPGTGRPTLKNNGPSRAGTAFPLPGPPEERFFSPLSRASLAVLVLLGAAGMFFGQPNNCFHLPVLALLYPLCLFLLALDAGSSRATLARGFFLGLATNASVLYWLVYPMHDVAGLPFPAAAASVVLLSCYLALFAALTALGMRRCVEFCLSPAKGRQQGCILPLLAAALLSGCVYGGFEALAGRLFTGFPWLSLSSAFAFQPAWVQTASISGSYGLSAVYAAAACLGALAVAVCGFRQKTAFALLALLLCGAQPLYGAARLKAGEPLSPKPELSLLMVQGNVDQNRKWDPVFQKGTLDLYLDLSIKGLESFRAAENRTATGPALVLWPETALPFYFQLHKEYAAEVYRFALANNINLMFGSLGVGDDGSGHNNALFNRVYLVSPKGGISGWYDKRHLVPFGEYIPFAADIPYLRNLLQGVDFTAGQKTGPLGLRFPRPGRDPLADAPLPPPVNGKPQALSRTDASPEQELSLGSLICYEAIFPYLAQQQVEEGADLLVNVSNDAWFRRSSAPLQHLSLAAMRAVEQARPIVRCTNTGITAVIDSRGRILAHADRMFATGSFAAAVQPSGEKTLFHRLFPAQEYFLVIMALLSLVAHTIHQFIRFRRDLHVSVQ